MLLVRTRDLTLTIMAALNSSHLEEVHSTQLAPEAVAAGTGTRLAVMAQPVLVLTESHERSHYSVAYVVFATTTSIHILDMRFEVSSSTGTCSTVFATWAHPWCSNTPAWACKRPASLKRSPSSIFSMVS